MYSNLDFCFIHQSKSVRQCYFFSSGMGMTLLYDDKILNNVLPILFSCNFLPAVSRDPDIKVPCETFKEENHLCFIITSAVDIVLSLAFCFSYMMPSMITLIPRPLTLICITINFYHITMTIHCLRYTAILRGVPEELLHIRK